MVVEELLQETVNLHIQNDCTSDISDTLLKMEVQPQLQSRHFLHHNIYESVKPELSIGGVIPKTEASCKAHSVPCTDAEMLFGVNNFGLQSSFCQPATNNNHDTINLNHAKGGSSNADRKRPYPCNLCPSRFGSKMELEEHQNSHTGMKPFECDVCKARFNRRSTLWNHKRIHSDAKPFVCTVCQMTFKWKNSLKCHKEMHLRKNESSTVLDNDLRQLTYATAAKRKLMQMAEEGDPTNPATSSSSTIHSQPLITTSSPKKKGSKNSQNNHHSSLNLNNMHNQSNQQMQSDSNKGWLPASLLHQSDHPLDLDTSSLDTLVQQSNQNLLVHLCSTDIDPRHTNSLLSNVDDQNSMLTNHIFGDMKPDVSLLHSHDLQFNYSNNILQQQMGNGSSQISVPIPIVSNLVNMPRLNGLSNNQQLPSVHHLSSTSLPSVSVNMDYTLGNDSIQSNIAHPQYIVTSQPDMMLAQPVVSYQQPLDQCVVLASGQDYVPNFDYNMLQYTMGQEQDVSSQQMSGNQSQQEQICGDDSGKVLPFEQW